MSNRGLMFVLMLVILGLVLPFIAVNYGTSGRLEGGWVNERSIFVRYGFAETILIPLSVWYILFAIVMLTVKNDDEVALKKKSGGVKEALR